MKQGKRHYGEGEAADPYPKGLWPTAKQSFKDLFIWKQRTEVVEANGDVRYEWRAPPPIQNPFTLFAKLGARGWLFFIVGLICWMADAFDFHALSIQTVKLAAYYKKTNTDITTAITLTLLLRSVGAAVFGLLADRYGRKWPLVVNMIILGFLQIGTIYSGDFETFLGVRALFGLFMGGVYGSAIAMALENCPVDAR
jgi:MFS family permease